MNQPQQIQIKVKDDDLKGIHANLMRVAHSKEEFCLDFFNVFPPHGILTARVMMSPGYFKRMVRALEDNLKKYETSFGEIEPSTSEHKIGFEPRSDN